MLEYEDVFCHCDDCDKPLDVEYYEFGGHKLCPVCFEMNRDKLNEEIWRKSGKSHQKTIRNTTAA